MDRTFWVYVPKKKIQAMERNKIEQNVKGNAVTMVLPYCRSHASLKYNNIYLTRISSQSSMVKKAIFFNLMQEKQENV